MASPGSCQGKVQGFVNARGANRHSTGLERSSIATRPGSASAGRLAVPDRNGLKIIDLDTVVYCEADGNYTRFCFEDKSRLLVTKTMKEYDMLLPAGNFFRTHNSYIINLRHVKSYIKGRSGQVQMSTGEVLDVARSRKQDLLDRLTGNLSSDL